MTHRSYEGANILILCLARFGRARLSAADARLPGLNFRCDPKATISRGSFRVANQRRRLRAGAGHNGDAHD